MSSLRQSGSLRLDESESDPGEPDFRFDALFPSRAPPTAALTDSWLVELLQATNAHISLKLTRADEINLYETFIISDLLKVKIQ